MPNAITWNLTESDRPLPWSFETKVEIFCERIAGWQLRIADICINGGADFHGDKQHLPIEHSGFAVLMITLSFFEMIGRYRDGDLTTGNVQKFFTRGLRFAIPDLADVPDQTLVGSLLYDFYKHVRCGLYHVFAVGPGVVLTGEMAPLIGYFGAERRLLINPHRLPSALLESLETYRSELLHANNRTLRKNFTKRFDHDVLSVRPAH